MVKLQFGTLQRLFASPPMLLFVLVKMYLHLSVLWRYS
jgi:hypothetical protein